MALTNLDRITMDPQVMGGKPCLRGKRVTVGMVIGMIAAGQKEEEILRLYPYLDHEDIQQSLHYAAWRMMEKEDRLNLP